MTGKEFKLIRESRLKYSQAELGIAMKTPKRTIQDLEASDEVRGVYEVCVELLVFKAEYDMTQIRKNLDVQITSQYPHGIPSIADYDK